MIERKILIGCITSTEFLKELEGEWNPMYMESRAGRMISDWCWEYFNQYKEAPMQEIETIFITKLKKGIDKEIAEEIEEEILPSLSEEYTKTRNSKHLLEKARSFFVERQIQMHKDALEILLDKGRTEEAQAEVEKFKIKTKQETTGVDFSKPESLDKVKQAFDEEFQNVIRFPGALGDFINDDLVRGGLVGIQAPEKRGKCLPGTQLVLTSTGEYVTIDDLIKQKRTDIISFDEVSKKFVKTNISQFWNNGIKPVYEATTKTGRKVQVTKNHPFLTPDGWQDLTKIGKGSFIAVPKEVSIFGNSQMSKVVVKLLAYLISDGCIREYTYGNTTSKVVMYTKGEKEIQNDFEQCINKFGCSVRWANAITGFVTNPMSQKGKHNKNRVINMLKEYGVWNKLSIHKTIPTEIFKVEKDLIALFLKTLFTGDGWVNEDGSEVGYGSSSPVLAKQVHFLLTKFGIVSSIKEKPNDKNNGWSVSIRDYENIVKFKEQIGFSFGKQLKLEKALETKPVSYKSFFDKFPYQIAKQFHDSVKIELGQKEFIKQFKKAPSIREQIVKEQPLMRQSFTEVRDTKTGKEFFDSQLLWDEIIDVRFVGNLKTYDLTVEKHHNFIAENVLVHNTFMLLEFMMQAYEQGRKVVFFQAGDMTEAQQIVRIGIYLTKRSNKEKYCGVRYIPVQDCIHNQKDTCNKRIRECDFGLFGEEINTREDITREELIEALENNPDYKPCFNCLDWQKNRWGTPYLKKIEIKKPLTRKDAVQAFERFFVKNGTSIKLESYANGTLTPKIMQNKLDEWKDKEGFVPDVVLVDYGDIVEPDIKGEFRHQENDKWKKFRGMSQKTNALWVVPTQAKAESYKKNTMDLTDYSEDKRKFAHVTAMYGLNQDKDGREKKIGIMRLNRILVREGDFIVGECVHLLQHLAIGRPLLGSYL